MGTLPRLGNMCSSSERHVSVAWSVETFAFLTSSHLVAMFSKVLL
jgi:hypothetical protein